jgi:hypothetical protein
MPKLPKMAVSFRSVFQFDQKLGCFRLTSRYFREIGNTDGSPATGPTFPVANQQMIQDGHERNKPAIWESIEVLSF